MTEAYLLDNLVRYIGRTVTIFTESGGLSGSGFTGVLASVCDGTVKLITDIGAAPACPVGGSCTPFQFDGCGGGYGRGACGGYGGYGGFGGFGGYNWLGSVTEIPVCVKNYTQLFRLYGHHFFKFTQK